MLKRLLIVLGLGLILCACVKDSKVNARLVWAGIYTLPASGTGPEKFPEWKKQTRTQKIPNILNTRFGIQYKLTRNSLNPLIDHRLIWRYPPEGQANPEKNIVVSYHEYERTCFSGRVCEAGYAFDAEWESVPGEWQVEVWVEDKCLLRHSFYVQPK